MASSVRFPGPLTETARRKRLSNEDMRNRLKETDIVKDIQNHQLIGNMLIKCRKAAFLRRYFNINQQEKRMWEDQEVDGRTKC
jgi:hypothetical protein